MLQNGHPTPVVVTLGIGNDKETEVLKGDLPEGADIVLEEQTATKAAGGSNPFSSRGGPGMGPPR
jgi:hypothetical protein